MVGDPDDRRGSPGGTILALVVGIVFVIGLITVFRWVGSLLSMGFFILVVGAVVAVVLVARRR